eukprot:3144702-Rhodomonas_salina.1
MCERETAVACAFSVSLDDDDDGADGDPGPTGQLRYLRRVPYAKPGTDLACDATSSAASSERRARLAGAYGARIGAT